HRDPGGAGGGHAVQLTAGQQEPRTGPEQGEEDDSTDDHQGKHSPTVPRSPTRTQSEPPGRGPCHRGTAATWSSGASGSRAGPTRAGAGTSTRRGCPSAGSWSTPPAG